MNHPTWEDFQRLEEKQRHLEEEVRKLKEQRTDEMKAINVNVASADVVTRLDNLDQKLDRFDQKQDEHAKGLISHSRSINTLQKEMEGARADILKMRESQADLRDAIEKTATKDDIAAIRAEHGDLLRQILDRLPPKQ